MKNANDKPPLLKVNDERGVSIFAQGSAEPTPTLLQWLNAVYPVLIENGAKYGTNVIEVTGHTDELPVGQVMQERKNLDKSLLGVLNGRERSADLGACDNVGLGMARAAAVVAELTRLGLARQFTILPLSAGPSINVDGTLAEGLALPASEPARRRIEIRLRRMN